MPRKSVINRFDVMQTPTTNNKTIEGAGNFIVAESIIHNKSITTIN